MTTATATDFRQQRDALKSRHKADTLAERRVITDEIEVLMQQVRRMERRLDLAADLPPERQPAELRALSDQVAALRAKRSPMLRPGGLEELAERRRVAEAEEEQARRAQIAAEMKLDELSEEELVDARRAHESVRSTALVSAQIISAELARRQAERDRAARYKGMTREQKLAELEALKAEVGES